MIIKIQNSVATLLAHVIKIDSIHLDKEVDLFCQLLELDFNYNYEDAKKLLFDIQSKQQNIEEHIDIINNALQNDRITKFHILEQINHIIYSDNVAIEDYDNFEFIRTKLLG